MIRHKRGLSFVEVMLAVVVLSLGITLIQQGFLICLRGYNYCVEYLLAQNWIDEKIWEIKDRLLHYKILLTDDNSGSFISANKKFNWSLSYRLIEGLEKLNLYEIVLDVSWKEGLSKIGTRRATYLLYKEK